MAGVLLTAWAWIFIISFAIRTYFVSIWLHHSDFLPAISFCQFYLVPLLNWDHYCSLSSVRLLPSPSLGVWVSSITSYASLAISARSSHSQCGSWHVSSRLWSFPYTDSPVLRRTEHVYQTSVLLRTQPFHTAALCLYRYRADTACLRRGRIWLEPNLSHPLRRKDWFCLRISTPRSACTTCMCRKYYMGLPWASPACPEHAHCTSSGREHPRGLPHSSFSKRLYVVIHSNTYGSDLWEATGNTQISNSKTWLKWTVDVSGAGGSADTLNPSRHFFSQLIFFFQWIGNLEQKICPF